MSNLSIIYFDFLCKTMVITVKNKVKSAPLPVIIVLIAAIIVDIEVRKAITLICFLSISHRVSDCQQILLYHFKVLTKVFSSSIYPQYLSPIKSPYPLSPFVCGL